jgi:hypothetical protein
MTVGAFLMRRLLKKLQRKVLSKKTVESRDGANSRV